MNRVVAQDARRSGLIAAERFPLQLPLPLQIFSPKPNDPKNSPATHHRDNSTGNRFVPGATGYAPAAVFFGRACVHATVRGYSL